MNEMLFHLKELHNQLIKIDIHHSINPKYGSLLRGVIAMLEDDMNDITDKLVDQAENQDNS